MGMEPARARSNVVLLVMNDATLLRQIRELASDSANIVIAGHAKRQMRRRGILRTQVQKVLLRGNIVEPAHKDIHGCWRCTLHLTVSGDSIRVAAALGEDDFRNKVVVITVMN